MPVKTIETSSCENLGSQAGRHALVEHRRQVPAEETNALRATEDAARETARRSAKIIASEIGSAIAKLVVGALVAGAAFGAYQLSQAGGIEGVAALVSAPRQDLLSASFPICGDGPS